MDQTQIDAIKARRAGVINKWEVGLNAPVIFFSSDDDMTFVMHAPADIDALLNEVERLADENQNLRKMTSALLREVAVSILEDVVSDE